MAGQQAPAELARVVRNGFVESVHLGHAVVLRGGAMVFGAGDPRLPILPRSALAPIRAVAALSAGRAAGSERLDLDAVLADHRLAVAAGSHLGEPDQRSAVDEILTAAGLDRGALGNQPAWPADEAARDDEIRAGGKPAPVLAAASGTHAAMLAACVASGWPTDSYLDASHPVQRAVQAGTERLTGTTTQTVAVDDCGACCPSTTLAGLARGMGRLAAAADGTAEHAVAAAMRAYPDYVGGAGHPNTRLMRLVPGMLAKSGAEGVLAAAAADGTAVAVKCADGNPRAVTAVALAALRAAGAGLAVLPELEHLSILGGGLPVGKILISI